MPTISLYNSLVIFFLLRKILRQIKTIIKKGDKVEVSYLKFHICQCMCDIHSFFFLVIVSHLTNTEPQSLHFLGNMSLSALRITNSLPFLPISKKKIGFLSYQKVYFLPRCHSLHLNNWNWGLINAADGKPICWLSSPLSNVP